MLLRAELAAAAWPIRARSAAPHYANVAANGITPKLPLSVPNADAIAAVLLAAGAEVDALSRDSD